MATITATDVTNFAPELSAASGRLPTLIANAYMQMSPSTWADWLDMGAMYLVCHMATLLLRGGAGGQITSESVGAISRSYGVRKQMAVGGFETTAYGQEYLRLVQSIPAARLPVQG